MRRTLLAAVLGMLLGAVPVVWAQIDINRGGSSISITNNPGGSGTQLQYKNGTAFGGVSGTSWDGTTLVLPAVISSTGTTAVAVANVGVNSCGTTAATIAGNDNIGEVTVGATSGTQCRVAFTVAAATRRECVITDSTTTIATRAVYVDSTHTDFLGAFVAGDALTYVCLAR